MQSLSLFRRWCCFIVSFKVVAVVWAASVAASGVEWPDQWVVFGPIDQHDPVLQGDQLRSIPEVIIMPETPHLPQRELSPQALQVRPGVPYDLSEAMGFEPGREPRRVRQVAYIYVELDAAEAGEIELGFGADWWIQLWLNGEEVYSNVESNGNDGWPISILNQSQKVRLKEGRNLLVARVLGGMTSALAALGDSSLFAEAERRMAARDNRRRFNLLPEFEDRIVFPLEEQAIATASWTIDLPAADGDLSAGALVGLERMPVRQSVLRVEDRPGGRVEVMDTEYREFPDEPVKLLLSKHRYPAEDLHLDAVVWTTPPEGLGREGYLDVRLKDAAGAVLAEHRIDEISGTGWFFSLGIPPALYGNHGELEVVWMANGVEVGRAADQFEVQQVTGVATAGRIPVEVINFPGATLAGAPMTVGVPFPRGALASADNVRLVDGNGVELPLQARVSGRWSRFGPVRWLLCDFTVDLQGKPKQLYLEYGPTVKRAPRSDIAVAGDGRGFPQIDLGRLRIDQSGLVLADGGPLLSPEIWHGAFVQHEDGRTFSVAPDADYAIEEHGSEKVVVRRTGWYRDPKTGKGFCNYVTRFVLLRNSPVVRVFHTWIFTGDGNSDRIRDMGWRFDAAGQLRPEGILTDFEDGKGTWSSDSYLVQHDYQHYLVAGDSTPREGRTPGVLAAATGDGQVFFGVKDFWQRFPNELEFGADAFTFYNWPRHNPPPTHEDPITRRTAFLHRYAHEGEVLDFRLPDEYAQAPIWAEMIGRERHWEEGRPETANAQGIARTEEFFLYLTPRGVKRDDAARVLQGLTDETLRAVVDPQWVAASDVFGPIHHRDVANFPEDEAIYEEIVHAPSRWNEQLGFYGKWLHGEVPGWQINLEDRTVALYRALRKNHHGWPIPWTPYARSGDPRMLKHAEAATRQQTDVSFSHYASADVNEIVGPDHYRAQGWWLRGLAPWAGGQGPNGRSYTVDSDYIWDAYYITGYTRARDVALLFGEVTKNDHRAMGGPRGTNSTLTSYLDMYQATFDPWFLVAAHDTAALHRTFAWGRLEEDLDRNTHQLAGHFWRPSEQAFERFTGHREHRRVARNNAVALSSPRSFISSWSRLSVPYMTQAAYAYDVTGDPFHLDRVAAYMDVARNAVYEGDVEYARGSFGTGGTTRGIFTGWHIRQFPLGLGALARAGHELDVIPNPYFMGAPASSVTIDGAEYLEFTMPDVFVRKEAGVPVRLMLSSRSSLNAGEAVYRYTITGQDGRVAVEGNWDIEGNQFIDLDESIPPGSYQVQVVGLVPKSGNASQDALISRRHGSVLFPYNVDHDAREVVKLSESRRSSGWDAPSGGLLGQSWFQVPQGVDSFWIGVPGGGSGINKAAIWNADGERVWVLNADSENDIPAQRLEFKVAPGDAGKLWRLTGSGFTLDPAILPYVSVSRRQWFNPEE